MIHQLLAQTVTELRAGLTGIVAQPANQIVLGPINLPPQQTPMISLLSGGLVMNQEIQDDASGQPRPQEFRQTIPVMDLGAGGEHSLDQTPLEGTVSARVIYAHGGVDEYSEVLFPGQDFTVDLNTPEIVILKDVSGADLIQVVFSFVGIFTVREMVHSFHIDVYETSWANVERWTSLCAAVVLTRQAYLQDSYNFGVPTSYSGTGFLSQHSIGKISLLDVAPMVPVTGQPLTDAYVRMNFSVQGFLRLSRTIPVGHGIITSIHTHGETGPGVSINPNLG